MFSKNFRLPGIILILARAFGWLWMDPLAGIIVKYD
jgi:hypothetical protein